ncbi:hypothetical protein VTJ04DRAFT_9009 [Mycothermus thermophilus]|uniref:uncharacterized protein n=1 Tax=Humicola insolens TaxID=85995 RepID=UPI003742BDB6
MESTNPTPTLTPGQHHMPTQVVIDEAGFQAFDSYPWITDKEFMRSLINTFGTNNLANPNPTDGFLLHRQLNAILQFRMATYVQRRNLSIHPTAYMSYLVTHPTSSPDRRIHATLVTIARRMIDMARSQSQAQSNTTTPTPTPAATEQQQSQPQPQTQAQAQAEQTTPTPSNPIPAWQLNAPKVDLSVKATDSSVQHAPAADGTPYPENFQAIVEAVTQGKPIPGIREIPDIVERPPGVTPFGKMKAPKKPWEKDSKEEKEGDGDKTVSSVAELLGAVKVGEEFPPLEEKGGKEGGKKKEEENEGEKKETTEDVEKVEQKKEQEGAGEEEKTSAAATTAAPTTAPTTAASKEEQASAAAEHEGSESTTAAAPTTANTTSAVATAI